MTCLHICFHFLSHCFEGPNKDLPVIYRIVEVPAQLSVILFYLISRMVQYMHVSLAKLSVYSTCISTLRISVIDLS